MTDTFLVFRDDASNTAETGVRDRASLLSLAHKVREVIASVTVVTVGDSLQYEDVNADGTLSAPYR